MRSARRGSDAASVRPSRSAGPIAAALLAAATNLPRATISTHGQTPPYGAPDAPAPGSAVVRAQGGSVTCERDYAPPGAPRPTPTVPPGGLERATVVNYGPADATVDAAVTDAQHFTLTITIGPGLSVVPLAPDDPRAPQQCTPARGSRVVCLVQGSPSTGEATLAFTAIDPQARPATVQTAALVGAGVATFMSPDGANVLAVQVVAAGGAASAVGSVQLRWDGGTLTVTAPAGFSVRALHHPERCLPSPTGENTVTCAATGSPPQLLQLVVFDTSAPVTQALVPPGEATVPAGSEIVALWPNDAGDTGQHRTVDLANAGDMPLSARIDDGTATLTAPTGAMALPSIACTPTDATLRTTACPLAGVDSLTVTTADLAAAQPLPQQVDVAPGAVASLVATAPDGTPIAVGAQNLVRRFNAPTSTAVSAAWDGTTLTLSVPDGFALSVQQGADSCTALDAVPSAFACAQSGAPPALLAVSTASTTPSHLLPATPPFLQAQITSPTPDGAFHVRQPVTFAADGPDSAAYVWDFGDGTATTGAVVQHAYATSGLYTALLFVYDQDGSTQASIRVAVDVPPVTVTYPAGWNLIGLPFGTALSGTQGAIYGWTFPPCGAVPPPHNGNACTESYRPLPPNQQPVPEMGY